MLGDDKVLRTPSHATWNPIIAFLLPVLNQRLPSFPISVKWWWCFWEAQIWISLIAHLATKKFAATLKGLCLGVPLYKCPPSTPLLASWELPGAEKMVLNLQNLFPSSSQQRFKALPFGSTPYAQQPPTIWSPPSACTLPTKWHPDDEELPSHR